MTQTMALALLALTVVAVIGLALFSIKRFGTDNVIIYATFLIAPPSFSG